jgi:hypothetical protein
LITYNAVGPSTMLRALSLSVLALLVAPAAFPALHVWLGTANNRVSDPANWSGGSPVNDPEAVLEFPFDAERLSVFNDVPGLRFKSMGFPYQGYTLTGESLVTRDGNISANYDPRIECDLSIEGTLTIIGGASPAGVDVSGAISGSGGIYVAYGTVTFSGSRSNTYAGETVMSQGNLHLRKINAIAIPANLRAVPGSTQNRLYIDRSEQIADSAAVSMMDGEILITGDETLQTLRLTRYVFATTLPDAPLPTLTVTSLEISAQAEIRTNLRLIESVLELPASAYLTVSGKLLVPAGGIRLHGAGIASLVGDYTATTFVDGVQTYLINTASSVEMTGGSLVGKVASLKASGGRISTGLTSSGDIRLGPAVTVNAYPIGITGRPDIELNGTLDLADAALDLSPPPNFTGSQVVIISNASALPVTGTFKGLPDGTILLNRWRVTYRGGDGNDVAVTELQKPTVTIGITQDPATAFVAEPVTFTATVSGSAGVPTGSVAFLLGNGTSLGPAALVAGKASVQTTLSTAVSAIYARYSGDDVYKSSGEVGASVSATYRKPVITSIDPPEAVGGSTVPITIRGTNFPAASRLLGANFENVQVVSSSEIRASINLTLYPHGATLPINVATPDNQVTSISFTFTVRAVQEPSQPLQIDDTSVSVTVTPGAKTAWISSDTDLRNITNFLADDDGDGVVRWTWLGKVPDIAVGAVDLTNGTFAINARGNAYATVKPFPDHTFVRDGSGNASRFVLRLSRDYPSTNWTFLWARPGVGAWRMILSDGQDEDGIRNAVLFGSLGAMQALGDSPPHPAGVQPGDVMIAAPRARATVMMVFATRFGPEIEELTPGVLETLGRSWSFRENDGVARLTVMRSGGSSGTVSVHYRTINRSAVGSKDFVATNDIVTFAPGETLKKIDIPLLNDAFYRGSRVFDVALFDPIGATLGEGTEFVVGIDENDPPPVVDIVGPAERHVVEGNAPGKALIHLSLTGATLVTATIRWQTSGGATFENGYVVFEPGERQKTVAISIPGNNLLDSQRKILVDFIAENGASMKTRFVQLIVDDDDRPRVRMTGVVVGEKGGTARATLTIDPPPSAPVSVSYLTGDGTAKSGIDYLPRGGTVVFTAGQSQQTIDVTIVDDSALEGDETFAINFLDSDTLFLERRSVAVIIVDDELATRPGISVGGAAMAESNDFASVALEVRLATASTLTVTVRYATSDGTATAGSDYQPVDDVLTFAPGETSKTIAVPIFGDLVHEGDETFFVTLSAPLNATLDNAGASVTVLDDDPPVPPRHRPARH